MSSTLKIFICYARADNAAPNHWLDRVKQHLKSIRHAVLVEVDTDQEIRGGQTWHEFIQGKLDGAQVAILLVSADFLASDYVRKNELPKVLKGYYERGLSILPVLLSPFAKDGMLLRYPDAFEGPEQFDLGSLQAFGAPNCTLEEMEQGAWKRVLAGLAEEVGRLAREKSKGQVAPPMNSAAEQFLSNLVVPVQPLLKAVVPNEGMFDGISRPAWASAFGQDQYGVWAEFQVKGVVQRCRWIKPGEFWMGSPKDEAERDDDETIHEVTLTRGYWLADTACTQALWKAVMGDNPSHFKGDPRLPVDSVSWKDCDAFCQRLNTKVPGLGAGFPTEAQWEYACRAGTTTPFSFGETVTPDQVNYDGNYPYGGGKKGQFREKTVVVGSLPPNPWGLYEMHGNLWEWCGDWYAPYRGEPQTDPEGPVDVEGMAARVLRGGSWYDHGGGWCRAAYRFRYAPDGRIQGFGFRLAPRSS